MKVHVFQEAVTIDVQACALISTVFRIIIIELN